MHSLGREQRIAQRLLRRIRFPVLWSPHRSGITAETMVAPSGRRQGTCSTGHRMTNRWRMLRSPCQAIPTPPIHMMFPGTGHTDIRRLSHLPNGPMCRTAPRRPLRFPGTTAPSKPSESCGATNIGARPSASGLRRRHDNHPSPPGQVLVGSAKGVGIAPWAPMSRSNSSTGCGLFTQT
jgi:hypothetical protein